MAKKNFSGGLDSLLGGSSLSQNEKKEHTSPPSKTPTNTVIPSKDSLLDGLSDEQKKKIDLLASKEGRSNQEIINEAINFYLDFQVDL